MKAYYKPHSTVSIAFRYKHSSKDDEWTLCINPSWLFGECDYKIVDTDIDDFEII